MESRRSFGTSVLADLCLEDSFLNIFIKKKQSKVYEHKKTPVKNKKQASHILQQHNKWKEKKGHGKV